MFLVQHIAHSTWFMVHRSFENNWNTYKLLAHINPPDTKVSIFLFSASFLAPLTNVKKRKKKKGINDHISSLKLSRRLSLLMAEQHQRGHCERWSSLCRHERCRPFSSEDGHHPGSHHAGCPWRLWWSGSRTGNHFSGGGINVFQRKRGKKTNKTVCCMQSQNDLLHTQCIFA